MKYLIILIILCGCNATSMQYSSDSAFAPKEFKSLGALKYINAGSDVIMEMRRESAYKIMYENCNGRNYDIEFERTDMWFWYVYYRCKKMVTLA